MAESLDDIAVFITVVEQHSFTGAARELHTTVSYVSKRVAGLEAGLGVQLLNRSTRRLVLTEAGELFYSECARALSGISAATVMIQGLADQLRGNLRVHAAPGVGYELVRDIVLDFARQHPQIIVDFHIDGGRVNLLERQFDVVIRSANLTDTSLARCEIAPIRYFIVASPEYLARAGTPQSPDELSCHNCLINTGRRVPEEWVFKGPRGDYRVQISGTFRSNNGAAIFNAAVAGLGIARVPEYLFRNSSRSDELEILFPEQVPSVRTVKAYFPRSRHIPAKLQAFLDFLQKAAAPAAAGDHAKAARPAARPKAKPPSGK